MFFYHGWTAAIERSYDAVRITNRLRDLPETLPYIDRPNQVLRSSEIGPTEVGCSALLGRPQSPPTSRTAGS